MEKIYWTNNITYDKKYINKCKMYMGYVYMLPLYKKQYKKLKIIAETNNLSLSVLLTLNSFTKIQNEIKSSNIPENVCKEKINNLLIRSLNESKNKNPEQLKYLVIRFYKKCNLSIKTISKIIMDLPLFDTLTVFQKKMYLQPVKDSYLANKLSHDNAKNFEHTFEQWLKKNVKTEFTNEQDIRKEKLSMGTPDILFKTNIIIVINGHEHEIKWIDVKNYAYIDIKFMTKSLIKQSEKYNKVYGNGAFLFKNGFQCDGNIKNVLMLDGSLLFKENDIRYI